MKILELGRMHYEPAWEIQKQVSEEVIAGDEDTLIFVEHEPVLTLGASFHESNLLRSVDEYQKLGIEVVRTDRGGDVTYHGPGQLVIYPIFDIRRHGQDLHKWMRDLEETIINALKTFGVEGWRFPPHTGVWVGSATEKSESSDSPRKIAAIGVKVRKWVNLHGIALNVTNDLTEFDLIVPCGIVGYGVTSLSLEAEKMHPDLAKQAVQSAFLEVFRS